MGLLAVKDEQLRWNGVKFVANLFVNNRKPKLKSFIKLRLGRKEITKHWHLEKHEIVQRYIDNLQIRERKQYYEGLKQYFMINDHIINSIMNVSERIILKWKKKKKDKVGDIGDSEGTQNGNTCCDTCSIWWHNQC